MKCTVDVVIAFKCHLYATYLKILSTSLYVRVIYMPVSMYILIVSRKYAAIDKYQLTSLYIKSTCNFYELTAAGDRTTNLPQCQANAQPLHYPAAVSS